MARSLPACDEPPEMAAKTKTRTGSTGNAMLRPWALRALVAIVIGVAVGGAAGVMTVNTLEPGRADSVDSLAVMLDSLSGNNRAKPAATTDGEQTPAQAAEDPQPNETLVVVPAVVDLEEGAARSAILDAGLQVGEVQFQSSARPAGIVLATYPMPGARATTRSAVTLVLSDGRDPADTLQAPSR